MMTSADLYDDVQMCRRSLKEKFDLYTKKVNEEVAAAALTPSASSGFLDLPLISYAMIASQICPEDPGKGFCQYSWCWAMSALNKRINAAQPPEKEIYKQALEAAKENHLKWSLSFRSTGNKVVRETEIETV